MYVCPFRSSEVSNGAALDFGWRIREMKLYEDENCETEVAAGPASLSPEAACGGRSEQWSAEGIAQIGGSAVKSVQRGSVSAGPHRYAQQSPNVFQT